MFHATDTVNNSASAGQASYNSFAMDLKTQALVGPNTPLSPARAVPPTYESRPFFRDSWMADSPKRSSPQRISYSSRASFASSGSLVPSGCQAMGTTKWSRTSTTRSPTCSALSTGCGKLLGNRCSKIKVVTAHMSQLPPSQSRRRVPWHHRSERARRQRARHEIERSGSTVHAFGVRD